MSLEYESLYPHKLHYHCMHCLTTRAIHGCVGVGVANTRPASLTRCLKAPHDHAVFIVLLLIKISGIYSYRYILSVQTVKDTVLGQDQVKQYLPSCYHGTTCQDSLKTCGAHKVNWTLGDCMASLRSRSRAASSCCASSLPSGVAQKRPAIKPVTLEAIIIKGTGSKRVREERACRRNRCINRHTSNRTPTPAPMTSKQVRCFDFGRCALLSDTCSTRSAVAPVQEARQLEYK